MHAKPEAALRAEYARLVDAEYRRIYQFLFWRHPDPSVAEDLTQETFLRVWRGLPDRRRGRDSDCAWLFAIARRVSLDHGRKLAPPLLSLLEAEETADPSPSLPDQLVADAETAGLIRAVLALPDPYRTALALTKIDGLSTAEAAVLLGVPQGTVKWRVFRALALLRQRLGVLQSASQYVERGTEEVWECGG